jgi:hypothetical protein
MKLTSGLLFVLAHQTTHAVRQTANDGAVDMDSTLVNKGGPVEKKSFGFGSCSKAGIGGLSKGSDAEDEWAPWGMSVSGNGMMAEAAAAGVLKSLNDAEALPELATISSVSGGSWFTTQLGFSKEYFEGVTDPNVPIDKFYTEYLGKAMVGLGGAFASGTTLWEVLMTAMYNGFDKTVADKPALNENRAGLKTADLLFSTTLLGQSLMSDNKTIVELSSNGKPAFFSNPALWVVPTEGMAKWLVPGVDLTNAKWTAGSQSTTNVGDILSVPTVAKIGSMSSAANGITAAPELSKLFKPQEQYEATFGSGYGVPDNGVCTTPGEKCSFPSMMAIDGCYNDNLGFALNVGYLQKKFPGKKLRVLGVSSLICDRTTDPSCRAGVNASAFRSLFADSPYPTVEGWLPAIVPGPDRSIFAESITDDQALGQQTGYGGMTFVTGTFTTVKNDHFGVEAGTKVAILVLNVNGPPYLMPGMPPSPAGGAEGLSDVAVNAYKSLNAIGTAMDVNDGVTSESAFLYFQNVNNKPQPQ